MAKRRKRTNSQVPAKGRLKEMADQLWSLAIRADWDDKCAVCGSRQSLNAHHLIPRQHEATRYDLRNGISLCAHCHQYSADISPHQNAAGWILWLEAHQWQRYNWLIQTTANGEHKRFSGTKNADYYCDTIRRLRQYVDEADYFRIVGLRFSEWLDTREETK